MSYYLLRVSFLPSSERLFPNPHALIRTLALRPAITPAQSRLAVPRLNGSISDKRQATELRTTRFLRPDRDGDVVRAIVVEDAFRDGELGLRTKVVDYKSSALIHGQPLRWTSDSLYFPNCHPLT